MPYDLKHITDFIFTNKSEYENLSHKDKEDFFFIINRKFARKYPKHAKFLNKKSDSDNIKLNNMVVISASICNKNGKILIARQFIPITKIKLEEYIANFPKLID